MKTGRKSPDPWKNVVRITSQSDDDAPRSASQMQALAHIGVSKEALDAAPQIGDMLKLCDGGMKSVLSAMRFAPRKTASNEARH